MIDLIQPRLRTPQELIQNADDAHAKVVRFYIDGRDHPPKSWPDSKSEEYKDSGPALIATNDAVFTKKDWKGIQQVQDSVKAEDPFNIGKFGIGFNAIYHITGNKYYMLAQMNNCMLHVKDNEIVTYWHGAFTG